MDSTYDLLTPPLDAAALASRLDDLERDLADRSPEQVEHPEPPRLGVVAMALDAGTGADSAPVQRRADERFTAASTIKVFVLQALLEAVADGDVKLEQPLRVTAADQVTGSGVLKDLSVDATYPVVDVATLMISVSDNTATNLLIDLLGVERVRASIAQHGWTGTYARGKLQVAAVSGDQKPTPSTTTPRDLADHFARLWRGELLPVELTELAKSIYGKQQFTELGRALDYDQYSAEIGVSDMVIASKSGSVRGVRNDAGVITLGALGEAPRDFVVAIMTEGCGDRRFHPENRGARIVGSAVRAVLSHLAAASP